MIEKMSTYIKSECEMIVTAGHKEKVEAGYPEEEIFMIVLWLLLLLQKSRKSSWR